MFFPARKLQAEIDLLRVKLATAERELAKMDGLKTEIERLKQQVSDRDKKIEVPWIAFLLLISLFLNLWTFVVMENPPPL